MGLYESGASVLAQLLPLASVESPKSASRERGGLRRAHVSRVALALTLLVSLLGCGREKTADPVGIHGGEPQRLVGSDWPTEPLVVTNSIHLDQRGSFEGNVAVTKASPGPMLSQNAEFALSEDATLTGSVRADTLYLGARSKITGSASYNGQQQGTGTVVGTRSSGHAD